VKPSGHGFAGTKEEGRAGKQRKQNVCKSKCKYVCPATIISPVEGTPKLGVFCALYLLFSVFLRTMSHIFLVSILPMNYADVNRK